MTHTRKISSSVFIYEICNVFSEPELKAQVHYSDDALSVIVNFSHFRLGLCNCLRRSKISPTSYTNCFSGPSEN